MKLLASTLLVAIATAGYYHYSPCCGASAPEGLYVEARSASVWAGGCHINGEAAMLGRSALVGMRFERGLVEGVELAGVELAAAVQSDANLGAGAARSTLVWIDVVDEAQVGPAVAWLTREHGERFGEILDVTRAEVDLEVPLSEGSQQFTVSVDGALQVIGRPMPDGECCTMPENVWYEPLVPLQGQLVGYASTCRFEGVSAQQSPWAFQEHNNVFVGRFGAGGGGEGPCFVTELLN